MRKPDRGPRQPRNLIQVWVLALTGGIVPLAGLAFGESAAEGVGLAVLAVGVTGTIETMRLQRRRNASVEEIQAG